MTGADLSPDYVLGHTNRELDRLELQGRIYAQATGEMLDRAGLRAGMRVLDVGCGPGDVSFLAAERVGSRGRVTGVDLSSEAVATARERAARRGIRNVDFLDAGLGGLAAHEPFDAVVGRFILMHQADPAKFLSECAQFVGPGGAVAFLESQMYASVAGAHSHPHSAVYDRIVKLKIAVIEAVGAHCDMGFRLAASFEAAGLPRPSTRLSAVVEGHPESDLFKFAAESVRSMIPMLAKHGIAELSHEEVEAWEVELREEVAASGGVLVSPYVVGASARLSG